MKIARHFARIKETKEISNSNGFGEKLQRKNRNKKNNSTV